MSITQAPASCKEIFGTPANDTACFSPCWIKIPKQISGFPLFLAEDF
jgi:hypothetical protein